jgi:Zn-dependent M28 family amino/carboxypeptidase
MKRYLMASVAVLSCLSFAGNTAFALDVVPPPKIISTTPIAAPKKPTAKKAAPLISAARLSRDIRIVSGDDYEGRGVNTPAEAKTVAFISNSLKAAGFAPGGKDGSWTQDVFLRKFEVTDPKLSFILPDGTVKPLTQGQEITISTRGTTTAVNFAKTPLVFAGYGVTAPERGWDDFKGVDVKGKIIVVLINDPDFPEPALNTFNGKAMTYYGRWTYKFEEAARRGAAGVLIIHDTDAASYGWDTVKNSNTRAKFDIVRPDPSRVSPSLEAWISHDTADMLFKAAGLDLPALRIAARHKEFTPVELKGVVLDGGFGVTSSEIVTKNVIGKLTGVKYPNEYVLYGAHWDHLGVGEPDAKGDKIFNGAVDNGTGIAALLELARVYGKKPKPERSVVMIAFTAEESGLLGSEYYASNPVYPLAKTVAGINMDALNVTGRAKNIKVVGSGQSDLEDLLAVYVKQQNRYITPDDMPEAGHFFRSDHFPLVKRGVPMLNAESGLNKVRGGEAEGKRLADDYTDKRYHQQADEWQANWDLSGLVEDMTLYYQIGAKLANSHIWPQWKPTSEFKAARDVTASERK